MRLLIITQAVDNNDPVLGFFVSWIRELSKRFESVDVICLREGTHSLPANVSVHSLGKENLEIENWKLKILRRPLYIMRFYRYAWSLRRSYDAVFVHMNQEYVLLGAILWKLLGKRVYMWRNHYSGGALTDTAAFFCTKVFYTSRHSYTAKFKNAVRMPVGVEMELYSSGNASRVPRSILWFARVAPSKRLELFIEALAILQRKGITFSASVYGSPLPADVPYLEQQKTRAKETGLPVVFHDGVSHDRTPEIFGAHEIFVNTSPSGMYDKTIFEAAGAGCISLASSKDFSADAGKEFYFDDAEGLAKKLEDFLNAPENIRKDAKSRLGLIAKNNSLEALAAKLAEELEYV